MYAIESSTVYILNLESHHITADVLRVCSQIHKASNQQVFFPQNAEACIMPQIIKSSVIPGYVR